MKEIPKNVNIHIIILCEVVYLVLKNKAAFRISA